MITVEGNQHTLVVEGPQHSSEIEKVDVQSEYFFLSQFQVFSVDKEVG